MHITESVGIGNQAYYQEWYASRTSDAYRWLLAEIVLYGVPGAILDLGCGVGLFTQLVHKWGIKIAGIDGSQEAVALALKRIPELKIQHGILSNKIPFPNQSFENVLLNQVVEHLPPAVVSNVFSECHRVLKRGGVLFVYSPGKANKSEVEMDPTHCNPMYPSELRKCIESSGLKVFREPNSPLFFQKGRILRRCMMMLLRTGLRDRISATANAYARRL